VLIARQTLVETLDIERAGAEPDIVRADTTIVAQRSDRGQRPARDLGVEVERRHVRRVGIGGRADRDDPVAPAGGLERGEQCPVSAGDTLENGWIEAAEVARRRVRAALRALRSASGRRGGSAGGGGLRGRSLAGALGRPASHLEQGADLAPE